MTGPLETRVCWFTSVMERPGERFPFVALQPHSQVAYEHARPRLARAGWSRMSRAEWARSTWPFARGAGLDVAAGRLVRITTGQSEFYAADAPAMQADWVDAGRERGRALVVLLPAGEAWTGLSAQELLGRVEEAAKARSVWAATVEFRVDQVRLRGPGW